MKTRRPFDYLIVAGGQPPSTRFLKRLARLCSHVVTVDRGAEAALRAGLEPDLHVGDDDSISPGALRKIPRARRRTLPKRKSVSDLEYAVSILPYKSTKIVAGAHRDGEGRMDHVFVNLLLAMRTPHLILAGDKMWIRGLRRGTFAFSAPRGTVFSVIPAGPQKLSVNGSAYDVRNKKFEITSVGLSNKVRTGQVRIHARGPALLFVAAPFLGR